MPSAPSGSRLCDEKKSFLGGGSSNFLGLDFLSRDWLSLDYLSLQQNAPQASEPSHGGDGSLNDSTHGLLDAKSAATIFFVSSSIAVVGSAESFAPVAILPFTPM